MALFLLAFLPSAGVLAGMLLAMVLGRRLGRRARARTGGAAPESGAIDGAVFALFGLLIAFTFSGANARYDARRAAIVTEANAIGTAYLRLDLLPADVCERARPLFREYLEARIEVHRLLGDPAAMQPRHERATALQAELWALLAPAAHASERPGVTQLVISALNEAFDAATARLAAARTHVPIVILALLYGLALAAAVVIGYEGGSKGTWSWFRPVLFCVTIAAAVYVTLDLEHPRVGVIRLDRADRPLVELLAQMR